MNEPKRASMRGRNPGEFGSLFGGQHSDPEGDGSITVEHEVVSEENSHPLRESHQAEVIKSDGAESSEEKTKEIVDGECKSIGDILGKRALTLESEASFQSRYEGAEQLHASKAKSLNRLAIGIRGLIKATVHTVNQTGEMLSRARAFFIQEYGDRKGGGEFLKWAMADTELTKKSIYNYLNFHDNLPGPNQVKHLSLNVLYQTASNAISDEERERILSAKDDDEAKQFLKEARSHKEEKKDDGNTEIAPVKNPVSTLKRMLKSVRSFEENSYTAGAVQDELSQAIKDFEGRIQSLLERISQEGGDR